jgi:hypothetical protein
MSARDAVAAAHHEIFQGHEIIEHPAPSARILTRIPGFAVHEVSPGPRTAIWTYLTVGVWSGWHDDAGHGVEFLIGSTRPAPGLVELLAMTSHYHCGEPWQRLDAGNTLPIGRPWQPGSAADHLLVGPPSELYAGLERVRWQGGEARTLVLLPITEAERDVKFDDGLAALEQRFSAAGTQFADPTRRGVV